MCKWFLILTAVLLSQFCLTEGCTGIRLTAKDGQSVHGRTFEFGINVDTSIVVIPREYPFIATTPNGKGLEYKSKYASIGAMCYDNVAIMDGLNEKGLSVGSFYFPGYASYTPTTAQNQKNSLSPIDFPNWILTQFATLDEVKNNLSKVFIAPTVLEGWGKTPPPFHYVVYDKKGKSIVIEPINGSLVVRDNPLGVLTNSPSFDWHMTNLNNYLNLTTVNISPKTIEGVKFVPFGQGSGMVGLPGDFTPPSRFVRAAIFSIVAIPAATGDEAIFQAFHILNQFDIPVGIAREKEGGLTLSDYTLATVVHDPNNLKYYFRTYDDQTIKLVNLNDSDKVGKEVKKVNLAGRQPYIDITTELKPIRSQR